jgi:hypothetical protein
LPVRKYPTKLKRMLGPRTNVALWDFKTGADFEIRDKQLVNMLIVT